MTTAIAKVNTTTEMSMNDMKEAAELIVEGKLFPTWDTVPKVMTLMLLCKSEGSDPLSAVNRYENIQGKISKKSGSILSDFIQLGGKVEWVESSIEKVSGKFTTPDGIEHVETFTMEDSRRAGLVRPNSGWTRYPLSMLRARCITFALRAVYPQSLNLMVSSEEAQDIPEKNVTPEAKKLTTPAEPPTEIIKPKEEKVVEAKVVEPTLKEFMASLPQKKMNQFLDSINGFDSKKLTAANYRYIDGNRASFAKAVNNFVKGKV